MDPGLATLKAVHKQLLIDESWTLRIDRGFVWTAHRLAQMMEASRPVKDPLGLSVSLVRVRTTVVEEVHAPDEEVENLLATANKAAVGSTYLFSSEKRRIEAMLAHPVHEETLEDRASQLASYAILQLCAAETIAPALAEGVQGAVAVREHPERGQRLVPDDMLNVPQQVFAPAGRKVSRFASAREMQAVVDLCRNTPFATVGASADGVSVEVPFGTRDTALIELLTREQHPWLGAGLSVSTYLAFGWDRARLVQTAALLSQAQLKTADGGGQLGAWGVGEKGGRWYVMWRRFVPNAIYRDRLALDVAMGEISRAVWADRFFYPDLPDRNAWQMLSERLGHRSGEV